MQSIFDDAFSKMEKEFEQNEFTPEDDYYLGRAVAANILAMPNYQLYTGNPRLTEYLNRICQTLVINSSHPVNFNGYHVAILNSMEFNAFATPGGHILITRGLIEAATSEDALAALIAHELSHIILRHAAEISEGMALSNELDEIARRAAALSGNSRAAQQALALRRSVSPIVDAMIKNGYSQDQELKADIKALELLDAAGYDPRGLLDMLRILQQVQAGRSGGFNNTHPTPAQRITNVNLNISRYRSNTTQTFRQPRFFNK
jgi:predicted Zn-dependent protease